MLTGKTAVVTGASRGIGRSIAIELTNAGANVVINYKSDEEGAKETLNDIKRLGGYGIIVKADVGKYEEAGNLIDMTLNKFGKIDVLVNNAGISNVGLFVDMEFSNFQQIIDTDLYGVLNCTHHSIKHMIQNKSGSVVNISSMWGSVGASCETLYSAAKGAVNSFTKALAKELGPSNIRVNAVAPGVIDTDMNRWLNKDERMQLSSEIPLMKFGEAGDVARLVAFLASDDSKYITGQIIGVDGGII